MKFQSSKLVKSIKYLSKLLSVRFSAFCYDPFTAAEQENSIWQDTKRDAKRLIVEDFHMMMISYNWSLLLYSGKLFNTFSLKTRLVDFVPHHLLCQCIWKSSSTSQYKHTEWLQQEKPASMCVWTPDCCFKTDLKNGVPVL